MDFTLPEELRLLQSTVRQFVQRELYPLEREPIEDEELPPELLASLQRKAQAQGLWLLDVPEEHGGAGLSLLGQCVVEEELFKAGLLPFRTGRAILGPEVGPVLYECNEEQKARYLYPVIRGEKRTCFAQTEPEAGTDPAAMKARAVRHGDQYVVNGVKRFITGAGTADFVQLFAITDPGKGAGGITCFLVDMASPGVGLVRRWPMMMGDAPWEIAFHDVRVPAENVVGEEGQGFQLGQRWITVGRVKGHGARCVGIAQRALDMAIAYARGRTTFGEPLAERQAVQFMVADSAIDIHAGRLMVYQCAWRWDQGQEDPRDESYMTKIFCTEMAARVVDRAIQVHGGIGLTKELPLERWYRQLRSLRITEGAVEVLRWRLARNAMKRV